MLYDFDDLLIETYQLLKKDQDVREKYREIYSHLLVDEFQDTNPAQMSILKLLIGSFCNRDKKFLVKKYLMRIIAVVHDSFFAF